MKKLIISKNRFLISTLLIFAIIIITDSCKKSTDNMTNMGNNTGTSGSGSPGANEVWIQGMAYIPATITVAAGTTITWTNKDAVAHTVTSNSGLFSSGSLAPNGTYSHQFSTAGTYSYYCSVHPSMTATVIIN
jgi:plastocyanin